MIATTVRTITAIAAQAGVVPVRAVVPARPVVQARAAAQAPVAAAPAQASPEPDMAPLCGAISVADVPSLPDEVILEMRTVAERLRT